VLLLVAACQLTDGCRFYVSSTSAGAVGPFVRCKRCEPRLVKKDPRAVITFCLLVALDAGERTWRFFFRDSVNHDQTQARFRYDQQKFLLFLTVFFLGIVNGPLLTPAFPNGENGTVSKDVNKLGFEDCATYLCCHYLTSVLFDCLWRTRESGCF